MTLAELIQKATLVNMAFSTAWIPLKYKGKDVNIDFVPVRDAKGDYVINMTIEELLP